MATDVGQRLIEDLREGARTGWLANRANTLMAAADEIERLRGVEADARRYRRIRNGPYSDTHGDVYAMIFAGEGDYPLDGISLDEAVDAAIKRSGK